MRFPRRYSTRSYLLIMIACYAVWVPLYYLTGWIGELRGAAFDPALAVDAGWPFVPQAVFVYLIAYVIILALFAVRREPAFLNHAYLNFIVMNLAAFLLFALLPSMGPERTALPADASAILSFMFQLDARWNAFPSLHVANPTLIALLALRERGADALSLTLLFVAIAIAVATLLVRQHYLLDVVGGMLLAGVVFGALWSTRKSYADFTD
ncbi:MAG: phosphatase PAP2 family protein [Bacteroidetes bacterium]|nr:phosphatase PAP2 family protein [Bacteroidota bacterium]